MISFVNFLVWRVQLDIEYCDDFPKSCVLLQWCVFDLISKKKKNRKQTMKFISEIRWDRESQIYPYSLGINERNWIYANVG